MLLMIYKKSTREFRFNCDEGWFLRSPFSFIWLDFNYTYIGRDVSDQILYKILKNREQDKIGLNFWFELLEVSEIGNKFH